MNRKALEKILADAKALWLKARQAKQDAKTVDAAYQAVTEAQKKLDDFDAENPPEAEPTNIVTVDELKALLAPMIAEQVKAAIPAPQAAQVTTEAIEAAITKALAAGKVDSKVIPMEQVKTIATEALKEVVAGIKLGSKMVHGAAGHKEDEVTPDADYANLGGRKRVVIEIPEGWTKGNLPLHAKQLLNVMMKRPVNEGVGADVLTKGLFLGERMMEKYAGMARRGEKALTSTGGGSGDELVPTDLSSELQRRMYLSSDLAAVLLAREIKMPTQPYTYPLVTTRPTFYLESTENVAATATDPGTSSLSLDAKKLMGRTDFSYEVEEDAIVPVLALVQSLLGESAAEAYEDALINGDTTGTHMDSDYETVAKHAARAFKAWRKLALAGGIKVDLATGGLNEANLRSMKKLMGKYAIRSRDLVWVVGPLGKNDMEGITNVSTLEKYGPKATILTGELASFLNIPIICSEKCRENLNAAGVFDNSTKTKGSILLANLNEFLVGRRREFMVEVDKSITAQTNILVASFRRAFTPKEVPSTTIPTVCVGYNYTSGA